MEGEHSAEWRCFLFPLTVDEAKDYRGKTECCALPSFSLPEPGRQATTQALC